jgi:rare lipoprotein A
MRASRRVYAAASAVMLAIPATAVALTTRPAATGQTDTPSAINAKLDRHQVAYGANVAVTGAASPAQPGRTLGLQFASAGGRQWRTVGSTREGVGGRFGLAASMKRSGRLRVSDAVGSSSTPERVAVAASFQMKLHSIVVLAGHAASIRGKLLPAVAGRKVRLEGRESDGRWHLLTSDRTGSRGGFGLRYTVGDASTSKLRVHFAGDRGNTRSATPAGPLTVLQAALASWYYDTGGTACGFQARYGVANRTLPCGTKVTFRNGSHQVTAVVDDRGPFVAGRTWDLGAGTRDALGFVGVGSIWASR